LSLNVYYDETSIYLFVKPRCAILLQHFITQHSFEHKRKQTTRKPELLLLRVAKTV